MNTREACLEADRLDPLAPLRKEFFLPDGVIYLDGNSLGVQPKAAVARAGEVLNEEWAVGLIRSWNTANWFELPRRLGNKLARLLGAGDDEVVVTDTTSLNIFKALAAALRIQLSPQEQEALAERGDLGLRRLDLGRRHLQLRAAGGPDLDQLDRALVAAALLVLFGERGEVARLRRRQLVAEDDGQRLAAPDVLTEFGVDAPHDAADER